MRTIAQWDNDRGPRFNVVGDAMGDILSDATSANRRVNSHLVGDDEGLVGWVSSAFARSDAFWAAVDSAAAPADAAKALVPCEKAAHLCVVRYIELARDARAATADRSGPVGRAATHMRVLQFDKQLSWGADDEPLTTRTRHARFAQLARNLETLERVLDQRCAEPGCDRPPSTDAKQERQRLSRCVCCLLHEKQAGAFYRRQARELLSLTMAIIERSDKHGSEHRPMPSGLPIKPLQRSREELGLALPPPAPAVVKARLVSGPVEQPSLRGADRWDWPPNA
jgi:hypothetical protein